MAEKKEAPVAAEKQHKCGCGCIGNTQQGSKATWSEVDKQQKKNCGK